VRLEFRLIKISKLTDYALLILGYIGAHEGLHSTNEIAKATKIANPTVAKICKQLTKNNFIQSTRGVSGGYKLTKPLINVSIRQIIESFEGPIGLVDCVQNLDKCAISAACQMARPWHKINALVLATLNDYSLADLFEVNAIHEQ